ncbi:MAG: hypothetical protein KDM91_15760 [Verrucomicrobiae bacterium]|nr:hypothetical protein [Verrucomicrobiae bacterium]MCP5541148.1 hypothetical protein [Akkermansiaceae bacterium]MCP5551269.1 hypothetical protein [Akkermansiaceae bacterium]
MRRAPAEPAETRARVRAVVVTATALAALMGAVACGPEPAAAPALWEGPGNLLANPSFENGRDPWISLADTSPFWRDFEISQVLAHSGKHSALLRLDTLEVNERGTTVWGVVRNIETPTLPKRISGQYRIENWSRGTPMQYLQVAVLLMPSEKGFPNFKDPRIPLQMAWVLTGIDRQPFQISNRKFVFAGPAEPKTGVWVPFEFDLHRGFQENWGYLPEGFASIRILFEARYDGWQPEHGEVTGEVYYDDLYFGD